MAKLMKEKQETFRKLESEIKRAKSKAYRKAKHKHNEFVINATDNLLKLYDKSEFKDNKEFLLSRYAKLERKGLIWLSIIIPSVVSIFSVEKLCLLFTDTQAVFNNIRNFIELSPSVNALEMIGVGFLVFVILALLVLLCWSIYSLAKTIIASLTRNARTTIIENEMNIIRSLLRQHNMLLFEEDVTITVSKKT